jgi:hypothetical protein
VAALVAVGCGSGGDSTTIIERTVTEQAPAKTSGAGTGGAGVSEAPGRIRKLSSFRSPSGNIGCILIGGAARCDIEKREWTASRPAGCPEELDFGQGLQVGKSGPGTVVCAGDTTLDPSAPVLAYGTGASAGPFICVSRSRGITCTNGRSGHGFFLSVQAYRTF